MITVNHSEQFLFIHLNETIGDAIGPETRASATVLSCIMSMVNYLIECWKHLCSSCCHTPQWSTRVQTKSTNLLHTDEPYQPNINLNQIQPVLQTYHLVHKQTSTLGPILKPNTKWKVGN